MAALLKERTIIRVKRKCTDDPLDALLVANFRSEKKFKSLSSSTVYKYAESLSSVGSDQQSDTELHLKLTVCF
jgi:hypothetical protein